MASSMPKRSEYHLRDRIQGLPQEMQDLIFGQFMQLLPSGNIVIEKDYKPPVQLHINKKSRRSATDAYYGRPQVFTLSSNFLGHWLHSLSEEADNNIDEIHIFTRETNAMVASTSLRSLECEPYWHLWPAVHVDIIKRNVLYYDRGREQWCSQWMNRKAANFHMRDEAAAKANGVKLPTWNGEAICEVVDDRGER